MKQHLVIEEGWFLLRIHPLPIDSGRSEADRSLPIDLFPRNTLRRSASPPHSFARPNLEGFFRASDTRTGDRKLKCGVIIASEGRPPSRSLLGRSFFKSRFGQKESSPRGSFVGRAALAAFSAAGCAFEGQGMARIGGPPATSESVIILSAASGDASQSRRPGLPAARGEPDHGHVDFRTRGAQPNGISSP